MEKSGCRHVISQPAFAQVISEIKASLKSDVKVEDIPSLHDIFPELSGSFVASPVEPFPQGAQPWSMDDVVIYVHSSGSTGLPKPVAQTQRILLEWSSACECLRRAAYKHVFSHASAAIFTKTRERAMTWGTMPLPTFHSIGIYCQVLLPITTGYPIGLYAPMAPAPPVVPSPSNILDACKQCGIHGLPVIPAVAEVSLR